MKCFITEKGTTFHSSLLCGRTRRRVTWPLSRFPEDQYPCPYCWNYRLTEVKSYHRWRSIGSKKELWHITRGMQQIRPGFRWDEKSRSWQRMGPGRWQNIGVIETGIGPMRKLRGIRR